MTALTLYAIAPPPPPPPPPHEEMSHITDSLCLFGAVLMASLLHATVPREGLPLLPNISYKAKPNHLKEPGALFSTMVKTENSLFIPDRFIRIHPLGASTSVRL